MRIINPSILGVKNKIKIIKDLINLDLIWIHYDIIDNKFSPNSSLNNEELKKIITSSPKHIVETHLMVKNPFEYFEKLPIIPDYASIHFEEIKNKTKEEIKIFLSKNSKTFFGIAINIKYKLKDIQHIINLFSFVLVMSVKAGFGGQKFLKNRLKVAEEIVEYINKNNLPIYVQIDGGVKNSNIDLISKTGVRNIVVGSFLINNMNIKTIKYLKGIK